MSFLILLLVVDGEDRFFVDLLVVSLLDLVFCKPSSFFAFERVTLLLPMVLDCMILKLVRVVFGLSEATVISDIGRRVC